MGVELELYLLLVLFTLGSSIFAVFEVETPWWRKALKLFIVMAATLAVHQAAGLRRAAEQGWPVYEWCYRETLEPHGWLTEDQVTRKRTEITAQMWRTEFDLQEPSAEGRAIDPAAESARRATRPAAERDRKGRFSARRKRATVLRLLRGEDLESVSRELGITAARASQWRDQFLAAGQAGLKSRAPDARDEEHQRLHAKVGELLMENELLYAKVDHLEAGGPLARRRSTR